MISSHLAALVAGRNLDETAMRSVLERMMKGECSEAETAGFLVALRMKGETADEIAAAARVLREHMVRLECGAGAELDTCGTGGDGAGTFNISTAAALVIAGAGVRVVKHGNRSVSSQSGSADVLRELGVKVDGGLPLAEVCLKEVGFAFCFAPLFHPALKHVAAVRRSLGIPTLFNCLGPLANPAGAKHQLLGVGRPELLDLMAEALARLGAHRAILVRGQDGLDEVSLGAPTDVRFVEAGRVRGLLWTHEDFGLPPTPATELAAADPAASAALVARVLDGADSAARQVVVANAAAGLFAAGQVPGLREGVETAARSIDSGRARLVLEKLRQLSSVDGAAASALR